MFIFTCIYFFLFSICKSHLPHKKYIPLWLLPLPISYSDGNNSMGKKCGIKRCWIYVRVYFIYVYCRHLTIQFKLNCHLFSFCSKLDFGMLKNNYTFLILFKMIRKILPWKYPSFIFYMKHYVYMLSFIESSRNIGLQFANNWETLSIHYPSPKIDDFAIMVSIKPFCSIRENSCMYW